MIMDSISRAAPGITGCWSAGERLLQLRQQPVWLNVWFHFFEGGEAIISVRCLDRPPTRVHGRWRIDAEQLVASFGAGEVRAPFSLEGEVLRWAGETLLRLPDNAASLPFGIQLPYHLSATPALFDQA
jgi:hypothetical protein